MSCRERGGVEAGTVLDSSGRRIDGEERLNLIREQGRKYLDSYRGIFGTSWPKLHYWSDTSYLLGRLAMVEERESKLESELGVLRLQLLQVSLDQDRPRQAVDEQVSSRGGRSMKLVCPEHGAQTLFHRVRHGERIEARCACNAVLQEEKPKSSWQRGLDKIREGERKDWERRKG